MRLVSSQGQWETYDSKMELGHCSISISQMEETSFANAPNRESEIKLENSSNIFYESELSSTNIKVDSREEFVDPLLDPNIE